jgi:hypothetical protein
LTLDEVVSAMHKHGISGSYSAVWRFFQRGRSNAAFPASQVEQQRVAQFHGDASVGSLAGLRCVLK